MYFQCRPCRPKINGNHFAFTFMRKIIVCSRLIIWALWSHHIFIWDQSSNCQHSFPPSQAAWHDKVSNVYVIIIGEFFMYVIINDIFPDYILCMKVYIGWNMCPNRQWMSELVAQHDEDWGTSFSYYEKVNLIFALIICFSASLVNIAKDC